MMMDPWSIQSFCAIHRQEAVVDHSGYPERTQQFLRKLGLPALHPFCDEGSTVTDRALQEAGVLPMGPVEMNFLDLHEGSLSSALLTRLYMFIPKFVAFFSLWFLLFAIIIAPLGCMYLMICCGGENKTTRKYYQTRPQQKKAHTPIIMSLVCIMTLSSSLVMMTDSMYLQEFGSSYGTTLFLLSSSLTFRACLRYQLRRTFFILLLIWFMTGSVQLLRRDSISPSSVQEGLYHDDRNPFVDRIVSLWDPKHRTYTQGTKWMVTGDVRTGLPFALNKPTKPNWTRVWFPAISSSPAADNEVLALDISFPEKGHDDSKPIYLVFHGLSGGSSERFIWDFVLRRNEQGSTVIVMVARGMMDTPIGSWSLFHGARTSDVHDAAVAVRKAVNPNQLLMGVGYSMGGIILNNYVATYGESCALDAAFSMSSALDCRFQIHQTRSKRLWQPMLQHGLKRRFLLQKHGKKVLERMGNWKFVQLLRASSVVDVDRWMAVEYHGYETLESFYAGMSALGDFKLEDYEKTAVKFEGRKIANVTVPLCILHALDDPIANWRTVAAPEGLMRPDVLVQSGRGNLMMLITNGGGHVGWPRGWLSPHRNWEFMNEAVAEFTEAVRKAKEEEENQECTASL